MAGNQDIAIGEADIREYLENESDFAFEIRVVKELMQYGELVHGGTYIDPQTQKPRQFDIRIVLTKDNKVIRLAVECKNLKRSFPAVISCLPRTEHEATNDVVFSIDPGRWRFDLPVDRLFDHIEPIESARVLHVEDQISLYPAGRPVGKTITQVGRDPSGKLTSRESDVYEKWAQALSSAHDLVADCEKDAVRSIRGFCFSCVIPVLLVPEGTLWSCEFNSDGTLQSGPKKVERAHFYLGREYSIASNSMGHAETYTLSHLEIVTLSGFGELIKQLQSESSLIPTVHEKRIINGLKHPRRD